MNEALARLRAYGSQPLLAGWLDRDQPLIPNAKGHLAWAKGEKVNWQQYLVIPETWAGYPVGGQRLYWKLLWWAQDAHFYVNGQFTLAGDLFDQRGRILVSNAVKPGMEFILAATLIAPDHEDGALYGMSLVLEHPDPLVDPSYFANELNILQVMGHENAAMEAIRSIAWLPEYSLTEFEQSLQAVRIQLQPLAASLQKYQVNLLGHSHIDMAWLWPHQETLEVSERTFQSVLNLQQDFPELKFAQSTAYLYEWLERERPDLFRQIQERVTEGRWEIVGGMWVEPDLNLPDGESIIRQILYGKSYFLEKFNIEVKVGWNPDSFGYTVQLPQIYKKSGIDYFLTQKLCWNDTTVFPYQTFWWQAPDGSRVFTYFSPPLGEEIPAVKIIEYLQSYQEKTANQHLLWLYGVGDHGGGPTRDMLETERRWLQSAFRPKISHNTSLAFFQQLEAECQNLPVWSHELYLEFHRGAYTTHALQKLYNRRCEVLLTNCEKLFFVLSNLGCLLSLTEKDQLQQAWKGMLFNQFHDILPGTSIPEVFEEANRTWNQVITMGETLLDRGVRSLANTGTTPGLWVLNFLNWSRKDLILLKGSYQLIDDAGAVIPTQTLADDKTLALVNVPSFGYCSYQLIPIENSYATPIFPLDFILENEFLKVTIDPNTGNIASLWDKKLNYELLESPGNLLESFQDQGQYWDAWNIDPQFEDKLLPAAVLTDLSWVEHGPLRQGIRIIRALGKSQITQLIYLEFHSPILKFETEVDWQECQVLLKVAFPLTLRSEQLICEVPMAVLSRPTQRNTPQQQAQFEVPALRWVAYEVEGKGVALLNDCKYGYDCVDSRLRLTLLRAPLWPDPAADRGLHRFTYALLPYVGTWQGAEIVRAGHALNNPLYTQYALIGTPTQSSFLSCDAPGLILVTLKPAESRQGWICRLYESAGAAATATLTFALPLQRVQETDLLERPLSELSIQNTQVQLAVSPWEIKTLLINFDDGLM